MINGLLHNGEWIYDEDKINEACTLEFQGLFQPTQQHHLCQSFLREPLASFNKRLQEENLTLLPKEFHYR